MSRPVHRDQARTFVVGIGAVLVLGLLGAFGLIAKPGSVRPDLELTRFKAAFDNVGMLQPRDEVRQHSIRIGEVESVGFVDGKAVVTMRLDGERPVYSDATAAVLDESALARKFVEVDLGTPAAGPLGDRAIAAGRTTDSASLDELFDIFDKPTRSALASGVRELGTGVAGRGGDLHDAVRAAPNLLNGLGKVTGALADQEADLPGLVRSADALASRFAGREQEITDLLRGADETLCAVNVDGAVPLQDTVRSLPPTVRQVRRTFDALDRPLADAEHALTALRPGADALGAATPDLRGVLVEGVKPLRKVPRVADQATPAVDRLGGVFADARPLVPQVGRAVGSAHPLLAGLAPYSPDLGMFFAQKSLLAGMISPDKHYFRAMVAGPSLYNVSVADPTSSREGYPTPGGGAWRSRAGGGQ